MAYDLLSPVTDGARRELDQILLPVENGVRKEVESVRYKIDGAWKEVWVCQKPMTIAEFTDNYDTLELSGDGTRLAWSTESNTSETLRIYTAPDSYVNPVMSFSYSASRVYFKNDQPQGFNSQAGTLRIVGIQNGSMTTLKSITLGSTSGDTNDFIEDFTLNGTFAQIGFYITTNSLSSSYDVYTDIGIQDVIIDGKPYKFEI